MRIKDFADYADSFCLLFFASFAPLPLCVKNRGDGDEADVVL